MQSNCRARKLFTLFAPLALIGACSTSSVQIDEQTLDTLVTTQWLSEHLDDPDLVVLDCTVLVEPDGSGGLRSVSGRTEYDAGHIPSAGFADLMGDLSDPDNTLDFIMPTLEQFSVAMGALGVGDDSRVVLYTANNPDWAARVWWMLRWAGFDRAALLDGGLEAWIADGRPLSTEPAHRPAKQFTGVPRLETIADRDQVLAAIEQQQRKSRRRHARGSLSG